MSSFSPLLSPLIDLRVVAGEEDLGDAVLFALPNEDFGARVDFGT